MPVRSRSVDPRAERVRTKLRAAAFALAHERRVDEITVGDVVSRAEVSRQVFYRHYRDRDDAVAAAITQAFDAAVAAIEAREVIDYTEARTRIFGLFAFADEHRAMYRNIVPSTVTQHAVNAFRDALLPACEQIAAQGMTTISSSVAGGAPLPAPSVSRFLVGGFMEVLRSWMDDPEAADLAGRVNVALDTVDALLGISTAQKGSRHG